MSNIEQNDEELKREPTEPGVDQPAAGWPARLSVRVCC